MQRGLTGAPQSQATAPRSVAPVLFLCAEKPTHRADSGITRDDLAIGSTERVYEQMCRQFWMNTTLGSQPTTRPSCVTYTS